MSILKINLCFDLCVLAINVRYNPSYTLILLKIKVHKKRKQAKKSSQVLTSVRNQGGKESMIVKFKRICQTEKNVSSVFLKYILQRKWEENVFKIVTEVIFQRAYQNLHQLM